jgi:hypothetical protein
MASSHPSAGCAQHSASLGAAALLVVEQVALPHQRGGRHQLVVAEGADAAALLVVDRAGVVAAALGERLVLAAGQVGEALGHGLGLGQRLGQRLALALSLGLGLGLCKGRRVEAGQKERMSG